MKTLNVILAATIGISMLQGIASAAQKKALTPVNPAGTTQGTVVLKPGDLVGLNPQPEPPSKKKLVLKPGELVGLNPQPEPPSRVLRPGGLVGLNPQPEPPSAGAGQ